MTSKQPGSNEVRHSSCKRILVVDDNGPLLEFIELLLETRGYTVTTATSPIAAAVLAQSNRYDLLITDMRMPIMSGEELASDIRTPRHNRHLPVLFISGQATTDYPEITEIPLSRYLRKPFSGFELFSLLDELDDARSQLRSRELQLHHLEKSGSAVDTEATHPIPRPGI